MRNARSTSVLLLTGVLSAAALMRGAASNDSHHPAIDPVQAPNDPVIEIYNVRDLLTPAEDFPLSASPRTQAFANAADSEPPEPLVQNQLFNGAAVDPKHVGPTYDERVEKLRDLIVHSVDPDSWTENGGGVGAINELKGAFVVRQLPEVQRRIGLFLDRLREDGRETVRVAADWVPVDPEETARLFTAGAENDPLRPVDPAALARLRGVRDAFHAEVVARNGQTVCLVSGREQAVVENVVPVVGTAVGGFQPAVLNVADGWGLELRTFVSFKANTADLTLCSVFSRLGKPGEAAAGMVAATQPVDDVPQPPTKQRATTQRAIERAETQPSTALAAAVQSRFQTARMRLQDLRTSVTVPLGKPIAIGGMTWDPNAAAPKASHRLLIVTVTASK